MKKTRWQHGATISAGDKHLPWQERACMHGVQIYKKRYRKAPTPELSPAQDDLLRALVLGADLSDRGDAVPDTFVLPFGKFTRTESGDFAFDGDEAKLEELRALIRRPQQGG